MLPRDNRLSAAAFEKVRTLGWTVRSQYLVLVYTPSISGNTAAFSVVVGKKKFQTATQRHRIRRRIYAILSSCVDRCNPAGGIFFVQVGISELDHTLLEKEVTQLLTQARIMQKSTDS